MAERDDAELTAEVLAALRRNTFLEPLGIQVVVDHGVVTLTGSIDTEQNRQVAEHEVRLISGVAEVQNQLTVMGRESSSRPDEEIAREVREQLEQDPTIEDVDRFRVRARFGHVIISGMAESLEERESVVAAAQRVPGVQGIDDRMDLRVPIIGETAP
jgi:osmotically-inducible protein OsmY